MKEIRILFTSVGRRVELVQAFKAAADRLNIKLKVYGADISDSAPALYFCDKQVLVPRINKPEYIPTLVDICRREQIDALIPTIDTDLLLLSKTQNQFSVVGTKVVISAEDKIIPCRDKRLSADYFISCGLKSPKPVDDYKQYNGGFPAFIKPKDGSSSINAFKVENSEELEEYANRVPDYIVQPFVSGKEYTVDIFCDFDGNPIYVSPRRRLVVRSGEVLKTQIENDAKITKECLALIENYKPCGPLTVQLIRDDVTGDDFYIEINPRFGGGAPLSMKAGADSAEAIIRLLSGERLSYLENAASDKMVFSRFDQSVVCFTPDAKPLVKAVVFDLDDTLFSEKEYVRSGFAQLADKLPEVENAYDKLCAAFSAGKPAIDTVLTDAGIFSEEKKNECLSVYRNQVPNIHLYEGALSVIETLKASGIKLGIITDGNPARQREKVKALGLESLVDEIIVTDELGGTMFRKPCDIAFRIMQKKLGVPFEQMVYVGDNPSKDFHAPKMLGMQSVWVKNTDGLYDGQANQVVTIDKIDELINVIRV